MIPKTQYVLAEKEEIPLVTKQQIRKFHSRREFLDFLKFMWGNKYIYTPDGEPAFYANDYERWLNDKN